MSRLISKVNKMHVRSPSPDIANHNSIVRTTSPIHDAMTKSRLHQSSKNPFGKAFLDNQQYQNYIKELTQQNNLLIKENALLREQSEKYLKQNDFLKEMNLKQRKQIHRKSEQQIIYQPDLTQYDTRILQLSKQCKRIQDLLYNQKNKNLLLQQQLSQPRNSFNFDTNPNTYQQFKLKKQISDIQYSLSQQYNKRFEDFNLKLKEDLQQKVNKINKLQRLQQNLLKLTQSRNQQRSPNQHIPQKNQYSTNTNSLNPYRTYSSQKYIECQNCQIYLKKIQQLQALIQIKQFTPSSPSPNKQPTKESFKAQYLQRLKEIKMVLQNQQIQSSIVHIQHNLNDIYSIDQKFEYMISQKNNLIQQLREKEVEQAINLSAFRKENGMLKVQVHEQLQEIDELKQLLKDKANSQQFNRQVQIISKGSSRIGEGAILRKYIEQAIQRIENLQDEVANDVAQMTRHGKQ